MKIALVSDTHGICRDELFDHIKNCDYLIHTGDFDNERTYNRFLNCGIPMYAGPWKLRPRRVGVLPA